MFENLKLLVECFEEVEKQMKLFKIGDRVSVYGFFAPHVGGTPVMLNGARGRVLHDQAERGLVVFLDEALEEHHVSEQDRRTIDCVHPKQCRRLVKKRTLLKIAEEIAAAYRQYKEQLPYSVNELHAGMCLETLTRELTEFVEVRRKK